MARFSFGKRTTDDEGIPPEPVEGESEIQMPSELTESGGRPRRLLVIAGIGVILIGGLYLANILFFSTPPAPPPVAPGSSRAPDCGSRTPGAHKRGGSGGLRTPEQSRR